MNRKPKAADAREHASQFAEEAVLTLVDLMRNSSSDPVRIAAARELIDRAHGKAKSEASAEGGPTLQEMVQNAFDRKDP